MIRVNQLNQQFTTYKKEPGFRGSVKALFKREFETKFALQNISFSIKPGELVGLIGANGAGKTTLVKILSGIVTPTSGSVDVLGFKPQERNDLYRSQLALIMGQKAQLWWDLPALDSFLLLKEIYQISDAKYNSNIVLLSEMLQIKNLLNVQVRRLSLGERMKVELMASLLHNPSVIFLDEPTIGLDFASQKAVREFLRFYQKEFSPIVILTSHYMKDIEELCERVMLLHEGKLVYDGNIAGLKTEETEKKNALCYYNKTKIADQNEWINICLKFHIHIEITKWENQELCFTFPKSSLSKLVPLLFEHFDIEDFAIKDTDIGELINARLYFSSTSTMI